MLALACSRARGNRARAGHRRHGHLQHALTRGAGARQAGRRATCQAGDGFFFPAGEPRARGWTGRWLRQARDPRGSSAFEAPSSRAAARQSASSQIPAARHSARRRAQVAGLGYRCGRFFQPRPARLVSRAQRAASRHSSSSARGRPPWRSSRGSPASRYASMRRHWSAMSGPNSTGTPSQGRRYEMPRGGTKTLFDPTVPAEIGTF